MALLETERFKLPLLATGQAHKELFHNEALVRADFLIHPCVQAIETDPAAVVAVAGQAWIVGPDATGDWLDHDDQIAGWTGNGWLFISPSPLMRVYIEALDSFAVYRTSWLLADAVASPAAGSVVDVEARIAIDSILTALKAQGIVKSGP
ncbi:MAG: DUF2793 domain-containing protein [Sphingomonadales bacterium]|nr:DUF2793 domain-containing protein [Sphingomonadales bacterium]